MTKKILSLVCVAAISTILLGCGKKAEPEAPATPKIVAPDELEMAAVVRVHPNARVVCYDITQDGYFLEYLEEGEEGKPSSLVWYYLRRTELPVYPSSNGTYFATEVPWSKYLKVAPDVTGLPCKTK